MIPSEEIRDNINDMGYVTAIPNVIHPSYYKLHDGTLIEALNQINVLIPNPKNKIGYDVNFVNIVNVYVPKDKRRPEYFQPYTEQLLSEGVVNDDVDFNVMREEFSTYDLSNKMILKVKTVVGEIQKTRFFTKSGEPIYIVSTTPIFKIKNHSA